MNYHRALLIALPTLALVTGIAPNASAHHESWILKNAGASCSFEVPDAFGLDQSTMYLHNAADFSRTVTCPVALSARWGSSNPAPTGSRPPSRWGRAYSALVYGVNQSPGEAFSCTARAMLTGSVVRWSRTVATTASGDFRLVPAFRNSSGVSDWGGNLEASEGEILKALDFQCEVPGNWSGVYAYKARICIRSPNCGDNDRPDGEFWTTSTGGSEDVQTSGIECVANADPFIERGHFGIRNNGTGSGYVYCPITPTADDTNDPIDRQLTGMVRYKAGGQFGADPPPNCQYVVRSRGFNVADAETFSTAFRHNTFTDQFVTGSFRVGLGRNDMAMAVVCELAPGVTLRGITTSMSVAPVSGGIELGAGATTADRAKTWRSCAIACGALQARSSFRP